MIRHLLFCICASVVTAGAADGGPLRGHDATPFECQTRLSQLAAALGAYERVWAPPADEEDDEDGDETAVGLAPEGVRVFGFAADELYVILDSTSIELTAFVQAPYDDVIAASNRTPACNALECRIAMPQLSVEPGEEGDTVISCIYERAPAI